METFETIFALSTAPGKSGVAVIRISGSKALAALKALGVKPPEPRLATLCALTHNHEIIDTALVLYFAAPKSFTGEDVVELHLHGSRAVITATLEALSKTPGLRLAEPGEFSRRAFMNGKMDLTMTEGVADLINAETSAQARQALRQMEGRLGAFYERLRAELLTRLAHLEAYIDFPDEEIPESIAQNINGEIAAIAEEIRAHLNDNHRGEKLREGLYAVILGAPNAGKSSLMNFLAKRDVAIVSHIAGTTRDIIEVHLDLGGYPLILADTAGLRASDNAIEEEGIRRARDRAAKADIKIALFDLTSPTLDEATLSLIDKDTILVMNKSDAATTIPASIQGRTPIIVSVTKEQGLDQLLGALQSKIEENFAPSDAPTLTRLRHRQALEEALTHLNRFAAPAPIELKCEELRRAARAIGKITGKIEVDELLDRIFKDFCIGK